MLPAAGKKKKVTEKKYKSVFLSVGVCPSESKYQKGIKKEAKEEDAE